MARRNVRMKWTLWPVVAVLCGCMSCTGASAAPDNGKLMVLPTQDLIQPKAGEPVDVVPFGETRSWDDAKGVGVVWEDTRDIFRLVVNFVRGSNIPDPSKAQVQYWKGQWPQRRVPRDKMVGSGGSGWIEAGDWYNGKWRDADVELSADGNTWTFVFRPVNENEYSDLGKFDARYRTTMKLRVIFGDGAPEVAAIHAFTDSVWKKTTAVVKWGGTAASSEQVWDGHAEAFNGYIAGVRPVDDTQARLGADKSWSSTVKGNTDGVTLEIWYAEPVAVDAYDETVVTLRTKQQSFSFVSRQVAEGERIFIPDFGVLVKREGDTTTYAQAQEAYAKAPKDIYRRIYEVPEQTLDRAWSDMPRKGRIYIPVSCEGGRQHFRIDPNGDVQISCGWLRRIKSGDSEKMKWPGTEMSIRFGMNGAKTGASLEETVLPIVTTWYERDAIRYTEEAFATPLSGKLPAGGRVPAEEPLALMLKFRVTNCRDDRNMAEFPIRVKVGDKDESLVIEDGMIFAEVENGRQLRLCVDGNDAAKFNKVGKGVLCTVGLGPRESREFFVKIAYQTLETDEEIGQLKSLEYDDQHKTIADYWRKRFAQGCRIVTPEPRINEFYQANIAHQLINCENEVGTMDRAMAKVGTFHYGVYANESVMMQSEIDRRGFHDVARKVLETWIHYQGTAGLPGDYTTADGVFYGCRGYQAGGYNQHHGWALWGMAEHYWFTRDKNWLDRVAPNLVKGCDWITKQRNRTKTDECAGMRRIEYGLLPPGSLEDIGDWRCWMSNNVFSWWGMQNVAKALAEIGHPDADRLAREAAAYREDIRNAFFEAMDRSPVVRLRDGSYIPSMPSEVHRRGRSFGWITETLEGSIHMVRCGVIDPDEPVAEWIMRDYEDNRYLSDRFGYQTPYFERDWFSIGGFSQQPSLLCSPTPYLMMDEPKQYVRAYFNAFAAGYFPERQMLTEHPLPNLGDYRGDHFKSSDEAMNTSWIRWMFIWDEGDDLYLGKTMPRYWLADGKQVKIERAATHFGPMSMSIRSRASSGSIEMTIDPPTRNQPKAIYARFRHPEGKSMNRVTVNGKAWTDFDPEKEWVVLPGLEEETVVVAYYD